MPLPPPNQLKILVRLSALELFVGRLFGAGDRLMSQPDPQAAFAEMAQQWRLEALRGTGSSKADPALTDLAAAELGQQFERMLHQIETALSDRQKS